MGAGAAVIVLAAAVALAADPIGSVSADQAADRAQTQEARLSGGDPTAEALSRAFRNASARAMPAVVYIQTRTQARRVTQGEVPDMFEGTPWEEFFRRGGPMQPMPQQGSGSGFIFRSDGYILTNNHVVDGADVVTVVLQDHRELEARVVGRDPNTDLAVVKIDAENLPTVPFGNSDAIEVGDWVVALGYPLQLGATATAGIVSAKGRAIGILARNEEATTPLEHFIQTDAAINPGNSGGPLVDLDGRVVGVNTAIASRTGFYSGYGFSVPANLVARVAEDLIRYGKVRRPRLGVQITTVTPADAEVYGLPAVEGAEVTQVQPGTPAERAGLQIGDVIVAVGDRRVTDSGALTEYVAMYEPGDEVSLDIVRYGEPKNVRVKTDVFQPAVAADRGGEAREREPSSMVGFTVADLNAGIARRMRLDDGAEGVVITDVDDYGPAARAGVRAGMIVERVNGKRVESAEQLERALAEVEPGRAVSLIVRTGEARTIINFRARS